VPTLRLIHMPMSHQPSSYSSSSSSSSLLTIQPRNIVEGVVGRETAQALGHNHIHATSPKELRRRGRRSHRHVPSSDAHPIRIPLPPTRHVPRERPLHRVVVKGARLEDEMRRRRHVVENAERFRRGFPRARVGFPKGGGESLIKDLKPQNRCEIIILRCRNADTDAI